MFQDKEWAFLNGCWSGDYRTAFRVVFFVMLPRDLLGHVSALENRDGLTGRKELKGQSTDYELWGHNQG